MLKQLFAAMNDLMDDIIRYYPGSSGELRKRLDEQIGYLRSLNDTVIDEWLGIEEKLASFRTEPNEAADFAPARCIPQQRTAAYPVSVLNGGEAAAGLQTKPEPSEPQMSEPGDPGDTFGKGQGYFMLSMFGHAAEQFGVAVRLSPEDNLSRMHLAMCQMYLRNWEEAQRQFLLLLELTADEPKWQALGLNALGCIQAVRANLELAEQYFREAHEVDPGFGGALTNLHNCRKKAGPLMLNFGSEELICLREDRNE